MKILESITAFSMRRPWTVIGGILIITALFLLQFPNIKIDTDPENMLQPDQPDRAYYDAVKEAFDIDDIIVVGIIDPESVFRPEALRSAKNIIEDIQDLELTYAAVDPETGETVEQPAIVANDITSIATSKNMYNTPIGVKASLVMDEYFFQKPESQEEVQEVIADQTRLLADFLEENDMKRPETWDELIQAKIAKMRFDIKDTPFLNERIASADGDALAIYIPITNKKVAYPVSQAVDRIIEEHGLEGQEFHVAGLPIAEETFGHEMFIQMAVVAPLAFVLIMLIVYGLFRQPSFLLPVGVTAALAVTWSMGLLIGLGFTVHIMSSMIPVFLLPIAILNSVHILSQFFDRFCETHKKEESLMWAMRRLYLPMIFTSLTSAVGFASLALADIPPVQVFGMFVSFGILVAWFFSISLVPAMVNLLSEYKLSCSIKKSESKKRTLLDRFLEPVGKLTYNSASLVIVVAAILTALGVWGIMQIQVNDNPVKWFKPGHPIREADVAMNEEFGGTYMTNLVIAGANAPQSDEAFIEMLQTGDYPNMLNKPEVAKYIADLQAHLEKHPLVGKASSVYDGVKRVRYVLQGEAQEGLTREEKKEEYYAIAMPGDMVDPEQAKLELFYEYLDNMSDEEYAAYEAQFDEHPEWTDRDTPQFKNFDPGQGALQEAAADADQEAYRLMNELVAQFDNDPRTYRDMQKLLIRDMRELDDYSAGASQQPVWRRANIWLQLKSGDNQSMQAVMNYVDEYYQEHPVPEGVEITWTGLTYINKVWQDLMVIGMGSAILGSFAIVFVLMLVEFRNITLGILSMIPLTMALVLSYGLMGWLGKDYDMPIAVCSSLSLGLAVDFAIHFLQRYKNHFRETGDVKETIEHMFQEPGRAIMRNAIVISLGFLPLMVSSLTPYVTVGMFFSLLMVMATLATIFILPSAMKFLSPIIFRKHFKTTGEKA